MNRENQEQNDGRNHYFYKITNLINGKFYYGIRTTDLDPSGDTKYMGSGKIIKEAIKKYGKENFTKEIIANYSTREQICELEEEIVNFDMINDPMCYNLRTGGIGGYGFRHSDESKELIRQGHIGFKHSEQSKQLMSENSKGYIAGDKNPNSNLIGEDLEKLKERNRINRSKQTFSIETRQKMSRSQTGRKHSPETIEKIRGKSHAKKPVSINNIPYESIGDASRSLNLTKGAITNRVNSELEIWRDWNYAS